MLKNDIMLHFCKVSVGTYGRSTMSPFGNEALDKESCTGKLDILFYDVDKITISQLFVFACTAAIIMLLYIY